MDRRLHLLWVVPLLLGTAWTVWSGLGLPPARWLVKYGLHPGCEPTGQVETIEGVEFVEIGRGIARIGSDWLAEHPEDEWPKYQGSTSGDLAGRVVRKVGVPWGEAGVPSDEMPVHFVEFPEGFWIARTEITNVQYEAFDPEHKRNLRSDGDDEPVVDVSWEEAKAYCAWLSEKSGRPVRLPSESEWEVACRAGSETEYAFGDDEAGLAEYAWCGQSWESGAHEVGTKRANAWGIFDLHGNVWEWCEDWYHGSYLVTRETKSPRGEVRIEVLGQAPTDGTAWQWVGGSVCRVCRGGGWDVVGWCCRSAFRGGGVPGFRGGYLGFRPAVGH